MIIKVCGVHDKSNISDLTQLDINWFGLNFYAPSKRYFYSTENISIQGAKKVGVFVNSSLAEIKRLVDIHKLNFVQLHGGESVSFSKNVQSFCPIIKVFSVNDKYDFSETESYSFADFFLFDTRTKSYGGSGQKFEWNILQSYKGNVPFVLAGGINPTDVVRIKSINHTQFCGIDINSGFEIAPGIKDVNKVKRFISELNN